MGNINLSLHGAIMTAWDFKSSFQCFSCKHVGRELNQHTDSLSKQVCGRQKGSLKVARFLDGIKEALPPRPIFEWWCLIVACSFAWASTTFAYLWNTCSPKMNFCVFSCNFVYDFVWICWAEKGRCLFDF